MEFGKKLKEKHFPHIAKMNTTIYNVGSFGISPKSALDAKHRHIEDNETYGDDFVRRRHFLAYMKSVDTVANLFNLDPKQCVLVDNVTTGVACILRSTLKSGDCILTTSWTYGAVCLCTEHLTDRTEGTNIFSVDLKLPILSDEDVVERFREQLEAHKEINIVIIDYITSGTACVLPVSQLTALCKQHGATVIIDGAHAPGHIKDIDVAGIGADYFLGALHKWCFAPKASALMWMKKEHLETVQPVTISWLIKDPEVQYKFAFLGTRDTTSFLCLPEAVSFINDECGGLCEINKYCSSLADEGSAYLADKWQSGKLPIPKHMEAPYMRLIKLPEPFQQQKFQEMTAEKHFWSDAWRFGMDFLNMNILFICIEGVAYIRVSFSVILDMDDIVRLGEAISAVTSEDISNF